MQKPVTMRFICAFNPSHGVFEETFFNPDKRLLFPDGRRLSWRSVCGACRAMRAEWEEKRDIERFHEAETARQRRLERQGVREANQREADMAKMANLERQIDICTAALETLRKKYFQSDDKNT